VSKVFESIRRLESEADPVASDFLSEAKAIFRDAVTVRPTPVESNGATAHEIPSRMLPVRLSADAPLMPFTPDEDTHARAGEQYRIIRTKIVQHPRSPRMMAISSVDPGDGKTVTSINVAASLALKSETNVLLVDCDLRRGHIADLVGFPETPGLTDVLTGSASPSQAIVRAQQFPNLHILPGGTRLANPSELLDSPQWRSLCQQFRKQFDYVILDTPPIGSLADYDLIQAVSDGILLVARPDYTNRTRCLNALHSIPADRLIGVILNCVEDWFLAKSSSHYGYYAYSQSPKKNK
jgi:capsular exopolysaccharide synthesis family protein